MFLEPLEELFSRSKRLVLDFTKVDANTPDEENFEKQFQIYEKRGLNPRMPENRQRINDALIESSGYRYLIGQYGEDRTAMLADTPAGKEGRVMHMAIDIFSKELEPVFSPCDGEIIASNYESGFGEYGNYIIVRPDNEDFCFFFGHLSVGKLPIGRVARGQKIARLGDYTNNENGGWSRHLHIQVLTALPEDGATPDGYSSKEMFHVNAIKYPNPLDYFPGWQLY